MEFRGRKGNLYEGGLRIPMIARWPKKIEPGQVSDLLWYFPDVLPTVAEVSGAKPPADIDGISIIPTLLGRRLTENRPNTSTCIGKLAARPPCECSIGKPFAPAPMAAGSCMT